ncbi:hypothetical protein DXG01_011327, partial [Tephrocybe rancida]
DLQSQQHIDRPPRLITAATDHAHPLVRVHVTQHKGRLPRLEALDVPVELLSLHLRDPVDPFLPILCILTRRGSNPSTITIAIANGKGAGDEDSEPQILMIHDTGATPTRSPNPASEHQPQRREQQAHAQPNLALKLEAQSSSSKLLRRRSQDPSSRNLHHPSDEPIASSSQLPLPAEAMESDDKKEAARIKRATHHGTSFPPVSSTPGLAALTVGPTSSHVPSWVRGASKKWEEPQRGSTSTKN